MAKEKKIKDAKISEETKEEIELEAETKEEKVSKSNSKSKKKNKKDGYFTRVNRELKKVVWPKAGEIVKYTLAVLIFCIILCLFFKGIELLAALLKELFV